MAVTRLSGGTTPANGSDPRTFPAIWNATADVIEANETAIDSLALTDLSGVSIASPVDNQLLTYNGTNWVNEVPATITPGDLPAGSVLQVVSTTLTSTFTVSHGSFQDVTGLAATITPVSSSSKIFVIVNSSGRFTESEVGAAFAKLIRGSTDIYLGDASGSDQRASIGGYQNVREAHSLSFSCLDSPATTSATTYKVSVGPFALGSSSFTVNLGGAPAVGNTVYARLPSSITLMEVAG